AALVAHVGIARHGALALVGGHQPGAGAFRRIDLVQRAGLHGLLLAAGPYAQLLPGRVEGFIQLVVAVGLRLQQKPVARVGRGAE
nr:hypothetical protein [Tanacetum cinerariifolium]